MSKTNKYILACGSSINRNSLWRENIGEREVISSLCMCLVDG